MAAIMAAVVCLVAHVSIERGIDERNFSSCFVLVSFHVSRVAD